jgi:hypothetical protein
MTAMRDPATERLRLLDLDRRFRRRYPHLTPADLVEVYSRSALRCRARTLREHEAFLASAATMGRG